MYWTDEHANKVQRANLDGSNVEDLIIENIGSPAGLAFGLWTERTNRYVSFQPRSAGMVAFQVEMTASDYFPDSVGFLGWVGEPDEDGIARMVDEAYFSTTWPARVHLGACEIVPAATYRVSATPDGVSFNDPLLISTVAEPVPKKWGDCVGQFRGVTWSPADGVANMDDIMAAVHCFQQTAGAPPLIWIDVDGAEPNKVVNFTDIMRIVQGFQGEDYPFPEPLDCP